MDLKRLRQAVDASGEVIFMTDRDGTFTFVNPQFERLYGYSASEVVGRATPRLIKGGEISPDHYQAIWQQLLGGSPVVREFLNRRKDGALLHVQATVSAISDEAEGIVGFLAIQRDITATKQADAALRKVQEQLQLISENVLDLVGEIGLDGTYTYVSPSYEPVLGYDPRALLGTSVFALVHPDDLSNAQAVIAETVRTNVPGRVEVRTRCADGRYLWMEAVGKPLLDAAGTPLAIVFSARDISERKRSEDQLRQSQKLEAVGSLAGGVAHDFNNLLTAILGYVELVLEDMDPGSAARDDLEEVRRAARSAESLTRQLLIFSRRSIVQPQVLRVNSVVSEVQRMLRRVVGDDVELVTRLGADSGSVLIDAGQLEQVLMNLVVNARDAMATGGRLLIETNRARIDDDFVRANDGSRVGTFATVRVTDTGCGMAPDVLEKIFDPFFTTKGPEKGTGLGLANVRRIVSQAGGHITVSSTPGHGSVFTVYFPLVPEDAPAVPDRPGSAFVLDGTETILLVEDSDRIRPLATRALRERGYTVVPARDAETALQIAEQPDVSFALLVTDVVLPGLDGRQLIERLRKTRPDLKVLYVSGYTADLMAIHGVDATEVPFLEKPYTPGSLALKVREVLNRSGA